MNSSYLKQANESIRSLAKRYKSITYSTGLVLLYLMLGVNAFSEDVISKEKITVSANNLEETLNKIKEENNKKLKGSQLELVQLIEQGD